MGKVYVVTSGEYSDYHISAIFSTKEKAEMYQALRSDAESSSSRYWNLQINYEIEEYELDELQIDLALNPQRVFYGIYVLVAKKGIICIESIRSTKPILGKQIDDKYHTNCEAYCFPTDNEWDGTMCRSDKGEKIVFDMIAELNARERGCV